MPYSIIAGTPVTLTRYLNGAKETPAQFSSLPIGAKTLIFSAPAATVTFSGAANAVLDIADIVAEINATVGLTGIASFEQHQQYPQPSVRVAFGGVVLRRTAGFTIASTGTANELLGFSTTADTVSAGDVTAANIIAFTDASTDGHYALIIKS